MPPCRRFRELFVDQTDLTKLPHIAKSTGVSGLLHNGSHARSLFPRFARTQQECMFSPSLSLQPAVRCQSVQAIRAHEVVGTPRSRSPTARCGCLCEVRRANPPTRTSRRRLHARRQTGNALCHSNTTSRESNLRSRVQTSDDYFDAHRTNSYAARHRTRIFEAVATHRSDAGCEPHFARSDHLELLA